MKISKNDVQLLVSLGDSKMGHVARAEVAEMYGISKEDIDRLILTKINGNRLD